MSKNAKRFLSLFFAVIMLCTICFPVEAKKTVTSPSDGKYYRIKYARNNRYLDIPADVYDNNGTQLQIWDYAQGNQNQIFRLVKVKKNWHIVAQNGKIIEVRDSSHQDGAQVAQWDLHNLNCGLWTVKTNNDGTVSFQNVESKKFLNVQGGGNAGNGRKIIQYHNDKTVAMKFILEQLGDSDIYSAAYQRDIQNSEIIWKTCNPIKDRIYNWTQFDKGWGYYPAVGQKLLYSASFLSPNTVANLVKKHAYNQSTWSQIQAAINGELDAQAINRLLKNVLHLEKEVPYLGTMLSILQILWDSRNENSWNKFLDAVKISPDGQYSGVIAYHYRKITSYKVWGPIPGMVAYGYSTYIKDIQEVSYASWTGSNFSKVKALPQKAKRGSWSYQYK